MGSKLACRSQWHDPPGRGEGRTGSDVHCITPRGGGLVESVGQRIARARVGGATNAHTFHQALG